MGKKDEIIKIAADLIHEFGYNNLGIKKILSEANIPKGSFYYYFDSKEDLCLSVIEYYINDTKELFNKFDKSIDGLRNFFNCFFARFRELNYKRGCPVGNLIIELSDIKEVFRLKLLEWSMFLEEEIYNILEKSHPNIKFDKKALASFIVSNFEGALLKAKLEKTSRPLDEFNYFIFETLLKKEEL